MHCIERSVRACTGCNAWQCAFLIVPILGTVRVIVMYLMAKVMQRDPFPGEEMPQFESLSKL